MTIYAYIKDYLGMNETEQLTGLLGHENYDHVIVEIIGGKKPSQFDRLEAELKQMDVVVVFSLQTFGTSLMSLGEQLSNLSKKQVRLITIEEELDTANQMSFYESVQLIVSNERLTRKKNGFDNSEKQGQLGKTNGGGKGS